AQTPRAEYDNSIPAQIRRVAELADLTPEEAKWYSDWLIDYNKGKPEKDQIKLNAIEEIVAARSGTRDFAQLFDLTPDEAAAYVKLWELTNWDFESVAQLLRKQQLTELETRAVKKVAER